MLIALAGFAAMYLPVYWWAANSIWQSDDQAHGAIVLVVALWLFWNVHAAVLAAPVRSDYWQHSAPTSRQHKR